MLVNKGSGIVSTGIVFSQFPSRMIAQVTASGEVHIDWAAVDEVLADPKADASLLNYARLMRACRDGAWKPLGAQKEGPGAALKRQPDDGDPWNDAYNTCFDEVMPLISQLRAALTKEWEMNHFEHCGNMNDCTSFGGNRPCQHERPAALIACTGQSE